MRTRLGYERLTVFADAVVAIAITLLVLPLVDIPYQDSGSVGEARCWSTRSASAA